MWVSLSLDNKASVHIDGLGDEDSAFLQLPSALALRPKSRRPKILSSLKVTFMCLSVHADRKVYYEAVRTRYIHNLVSAMSGVTGLAGSSKTTCLLTRGIFVIY